MDNAWDRYQVYLSVKTFSPYSVRNYKTALIDFLRFLQSKQLQSVADVDANTVRSYLLSLSEKGTGKASVARIVSALKSFYTFLIQEGELTINPMSNIHLPKRDKLLPEYLTVEEAQHLLERPRTSQPPRVCVTEPSWKSCGLVGSESVKWLA